jgi:hypothetical protein
MVRRSILEDIYHEIRRLRNRLDDIERSFSNWNPQPIEINDSDLLTLPDHLRKSYLIVASKGECSASLVSGLSGRCRAIESNYLNQLVRMGWLSKRREAKSISFRPASSDVNGYKAFGSVQYSFASSR